jgi:hypothetical protein
MARIVALITGLTTMVILRATSITNVLIGKREVQLM